MNGKPLRIAENGDGYSAADLASERGEIAVDVLPVPIVGALHRAAIKVARSFDRSERLRVRNGGEGEEAKNEKSGKPTKHLRSFHAASSKQRDGSRGVHPIGGVPRPAAIAAGRKYDQGVQLPEVGVPGDAVGRGLTSIG